MAALTHLGVGFAAKSIAPKVNVVYLIIAAWLIDIIWAVFYFAGIEKLPGPGIDTTNPYSHGLFMAILWTLATAVVTYLVSNNKRTSIIIGLLVFSHWIIDFISHPMTAVYPDDPKLSIFFDGSSTVGLGLWSNQLAVNIGEYGILALGIAIYIYIKIKLRKEKQKLQEHFS